MSPIKIHIEVLKMNNKFNSIEAIKNYKSNLGAIIEKEKFLIFYLKIKVKKLKV